MDVAPVYDGISRLLCGAEGCYTGENRTAYIMISCRAFGATAFSLLLNGLIDISPPNRLLALSLIISSIVVLS